MVTNQSPQSRKELKWRVLAQVSENIYILCSTSDGYVRYAPMYIHSFRLIAPRRLLEAQLFNLQYQNYYKDQGKMIREYRESLGLKKKEFARLIKLDPGTLRCWENNQKRMIKDSWEKYFKDLIKV